MTTRTFKTPEELMMALLQGETFKLDQESGYYYYDKNRNWLSAMRYMNSRGTSKLMSSATAALCDGKTLWCKVKKKTGLDLRKEKYASGDYILVAPSKEWVIVENPLWDCDNYRLIHKKHKKELEAYLAGNGGMIEFMGVDGWEWYGAFDFIKDYNEAFEYRLKPKKKTISLAMFTCKYKNSKVWCNANVYETLESFIAYFSITKYSNHHEIPNTRHEIEVNDE